MLRLLRDGRFPLFLSAILALAGCGGGEEAGGDAAEKPEKPVKETATKGIKSVDVSKLPKVGDPLPPQDSGRVEPAPPDGWRAAPRKSEYIGQFSRKTGELPRIDITAKESPFNEIKELTEENAADVAGRLEKGVKKAVLIESHKPLRIGDRVWVRHVRKVKYGKNDEAQIQSLETIFDGRLYSVNLVVMGQTAEELLVERDNGYTVAANMKFKLEEKRPPLSLPAEQPAEGAPANPTP